MRQLPLKIFNITKWTYERVVVAGHPDLTDVTYTNLIENGDKLTEANASNETENTLKLLKSREVKAYSNVARSLIRGNESDKNLALEIVNFMKSFPKMQSPQKNLSTVLAKKYALLKEQQQQNTQSKQLE